MTRHLASTPLVLLFVTACGGPTPIELPDTADGTLRVCLEQVCAGNPLVVWDALPASYRTDVTDLAHRVGARMDDELLTAAGTALDKAVALMATRKDWLVQGLHETFGRGAGPAGIGDHWDSILALAKAIAQSELRSAAKLSSLDVGRFLAGSGTGMLKGLRGMSSLFPADPFARLARVGCEAGQVIDGVASVQMLMDGRPDGPVEKFQQVEGRWVFVDMAKDWPRAMAEARKGIDSIDLAKNKVETQKALALLNEALDGLAAAKDYEGFRQQLAKAMGRCSTVSRALGFDD